MQLAEDGVVERTHHARDVHQRRTPAATVGERATRLAFEIDDGEVPRAVEHLSQMEVTVHADELPVERASQEHVQARVDGRALLQHASAESARRLGQPWLCMAQHLERPRGQRAQRLVAGTTRQGGVADRREVRMLRRCQPTVQLRGPPRHQAHGLQVATD
jgi:hypothetical protein